MRDRSFSSLLPAQVRTVVALTLVIAVPVFGAAWLNTWTVFAFPLGIFVLALVVPAALIGVAFGVPRARDADPAAEP